MHSSACPVRQSRRDPRGSRGAKRPEEDVPAAACLVSVQMRAVACLDGA